MIRQDLMSESLRLWVGDADYEVSIAPGLPGPEPCQEVVFREDIGIGAMSTAGVPFYFEAGTLQEAFSRALRIFGAEATPEDIAALEACGEEYCPD